MFAAPMFVMPGGWELLLIVFVLILLFGAKKLPDLARGTGRALRIFKSETRGLMDDDDHSDRDHAHDKPDGYDDRPRPLTSGEQPAPIQRPSETTNPTHHPHSS